VKHLKVDKIAQRFARQVCDALFDADFFNATRRIRPLTLKRQIGEVNKGAPREIRRRLRAVSNRIDMIETLSDVNKKQCFEWGLTAGISFAVSCMEMARLRPTNGSRTENPVWEYVSSPLKKAGFCAIGSRKRICRLP
jgi:hypothetical protein